MILSLKNIPILGAVLLLAPTGSFHKSVLATKPQPTPQYQAQANPQIHQVFQPIIAKLKQSTKITVVLPKFIPFSDGEDKLYAVIESATPKKYSIILGFPPDCGGGTACRLGTLTGEAVTNKTPRFTGKTVTLAKGITGYFEDYKCGANCSDATVTWRSKGVQYSVGLKAGDATSLVKMANSAIAP
jgi:hypothetical protein